LHKQEEVDRSNRPLNNHRHNRLLMEVVVVVVEEEAEEVVAADPHPWQEEQLHNKQQHLKLERTAP